MWRTIYDLTGTAYSVNFNNVSFVAKITEHNAEWLGLPIESIGYTVVSTSSGGSIITREDADSIMHDVVRMNNVLM